MTFDKLRLSIYESYRNGEINRSVATDMLESVLNMEGDYIVAESEEIRSDFMGVALECANGNVEFSVFEKKAETFGDKVKGVWKKFVDWVKKIVNSIKNKLFPKKKVTVSVSEEFLKFCDSVANTANQIKANGDLIKIAKAIGGIAVAGLSIFGGKKLVKKNADWVHAKLVKTAETLRAAVEWLYDKLPKGLQESGIMAPIRNALHKVDTATTQVAKKAQSIMLQNEELNAKYPRGNALDTAPEFSNNDDDETNSLTYKNLVKELKQFSIPEADYPKTIDGVKNMLARYKKQKDDANAAKVQKMDDQDAEDNLNTDVLGSSRSPWESTEYNLDDGYDPMFESMLNDLNFDF